MHDVLDHLAKRIDAAAAALTALLDDVEKQSEVEAKRLEEASEGDDFDDEAASAQAEVVEAMQQALERLETAEDALIRARDALRDARRD
jgi:Spy/CpxP family protein refolding chaperone